MNSDAWIGYLSEWLGVIAVTMILSLSPVIRKRRALEFKYPKREGLVALSLFALVVGLSFVLYRGGVTLRTPVPDALLQPLWPRLFAAGLSLLPFVLALLVRKQPFLSSGWPRPLLSASFQLGAALLFLTIFLRFKLNNIIDGLTQAEIIALLLLLVICFTEETIFRGFIQARLSSWWGSLPGWISTSLMFVLWQLPRILIMPGVLWEALVIAAIESLLVGWVMRKNGHVLAPALYRAISGWLMMLS